MWLLPAIAKFLELQVRDMLTGDNHTEWEGGMCNLHVTLTES